LQKASISSMKGCRQLGIKVRLSHSRGYYERSSVGPGGQSRSSWSLRPVARSLEQRTQLNCWMPSIGPTLRLKPKGCL